MAAPLVTARLASRPRRLRAGIALLALLALTGCVTLGESGRESELARTRGDFAVLAKRPDRVVFAARGRKVVVRSPEGYCLDPEALETTGGSAFALISDCLEDRRAELAQEARAEGEGEVLAIDLPRSFPGIMTVSISGEPGVGAEPGALDAFETLLRSQQGRALLSRGSNGASGRIIATRRIGGAIYVLVGEDALAPGLLAPRFWRGFLDVNRRLVLVTVSSFSDRPIGEDGMMAFLAEQMVQLRRANGLPEVAEEGRIAGELAKVFAEAPAEPLEVIRSEAGAVTEDGVAPSRAPRPPRSPKAPRRPVAVPQPQAPAAQAPAPQTPAPQTPAPRTPTTQAPPATAGRVPLPPPRPARRGTAAPPATPPATVPAATAPVQAPARPAAPGLSSARDPAPVKAPMPPRRPR